MKNFICAVFLLFSADAATAQNGKIIKSYNVVYPDSVVTPLINRAVRFKDVLEQTKTTGFTYLSDGLKIQGYLMAPKAAGKYPCLIFCRGGHENFGATDLYTTALLADIAYHGYVVITSQLRGTAGCEGKDEYGGADTADVINCIPALANFPETDTSRIGIYGISRGGLNALQVLRSQKNIKAAIINSGFVDAFDALNRIDGKEFEDEVYKKLIPGYTKNKKRELIRRSPRYWPEQICRTTPILILQGSSDWRVNAETTLSFTDQLYRLKQPLRLVLVEGGTHGLRVPLRDTMLYEWLDKYLKNNAPLPDMNLHGE